MLKTKQLSSKNLTENDIKTKIAKIADETKRLAKQALIEYYTPTFSNKNSRDLDDIIAEKYHQTGKDNIIKSLADFKELCYFYKKYSLDVVLDSANDPYS